RVAGKDEDDSLFASDLAHGNKLFESGEGNGRGRLATYALSADLGFGKGDLLLGDLFAPAAEPVDDVGSLAPGGGIADADRRSPGVCGNGTHHAVGVHEPAVERIGSLGLNDADLRDARDEAQTVHLDEALAQRGGVGQVAAGNDDVVRYLPVELLKNLEGGSLLALKPIGVDRVEQIDGKTGDQIGEDANAA